MKIRFSLRTLCIVCVVVIPLIFSILWLVAPRWSDDYWIFVMRPTETVREVTVAKCELDTYTFSTPNGQPFYGMSEGQVRTAVFSRILHLEDREAKHVLLGKSGHFAYYVVPTDGRFGGWIYSARELVPGEKVTVRQYHLAKSLRDYSAETEDPSLKPIRLYFVDESP